MELPQRKKNRLEGYDYSWAGYYFITACTKNREHLLGDIVGRDDPGAPVVRLSNYGRMVEKYIASIPSAYRNVSVNHHVVMPNHIHIIICVHSLECGRVGELRDGAPGSSRPTELIPRVIGALKRFTNQEAGFNLWQKSYHDHVIRNDADYQRIWQYIDTNPAKWREDCYYTESTEETP